MQGTLVKHNFEFTKTIWRFLFLYSRPSIAARSISVDSTNHTQKIILKKRNPGSFKKQNLNLPHIVHCIYKYTDDVLGYANTMLLNIRKLHICGFWYPWSRICVLEPSLCGYWRMTILQTMSTHSSPTFQLQTLHRPQEKCHKEVGEWRDVKMSSVIYPKYKFLFYNLIYMQDQTIKHLWPCGKSLGNKSIQVLQLSAMTQNRV